MNQEKIGKFIAKLRKEKNINQEMLAEQLYVDRSLISKWENGRLLPDVKYLTILCNIFNVKIEELLYGEKISESNINKVNNNLIQFLVNNYKKYKHFKFAFFISFCVAFIVIILFLIYFFCETYNSILVYKVSFKNDFYSSENGLLILTREDSYLKFENIDQETNIELYYLNDKNNKEIIYEGNINNILYDSYGYNANINLKNFNKIKNSLYIRIKEENIKVNFTKLYSNNSLLFKKFKPYGNQKHSKTTIDIPTKIKNKFNCNEDTCTFSNTSLLS